MAFAGLHVVCAYAGATGDHAYPLLCNAVWSQTFASPGTTTLGAPAPGNPLFHIRAAADSWVAIGKSPTASGSPRYLIPADTDVDIYCNAGDLLAWTTA